MVLTFFGLVTLMVRAMGCGEQRLIFNRLLKMLSVCRDYAPFFYFPPPEATSRAYSRPLQGRILAVLVIVDASVF
jgi:hypothetical protein